MTINPIFFVWEFPWQCFESTIKINSFQQQIFNFIDKATFLYEQEIPRASDYAPSRTFYLFSVDLRQLSRMLIEKSYQVIN